MYTRVLAEQNLSICIRVCVCVCVVWRDPNARVKLGEIVYDDGENVQRFSVASVCVWMARFGHDVVSFVCCVHYVVLDVCVCMCVYVTQTLRASTASVLCIRM